MATFVGNPAATALTGAEIVPISQGGVDKRTTTQQIADANESKSVDLASASTTDIGAATTPFLHVTGTTTITALGDAQAGARRRVVFDDSLILTHNGTTLILPTGLDVTTAAGDGALFISEGGGNWRCVDYQRADGTPLAGGGGGGGSPGGSDTQVQFNDSGSFGGDAGLVFNKTTDTLTLVNATFTGLALTAASATGGAGLRLPHGAAPTTPVDGDVWTTSAGGMYVRINGVTVGPLGASGGGGLTGFTSALNTASPNNTINASSLTPSGGTTNQDGVYGSKGTGALQAQVADNTTAGGNRRGANAVDWQTKRSANTAVASGADSVAMGVNNTASGQTSVAIGSGAAATGTSTVAIGTTASSSGASGSVAIGPSATASGNRSVAIGGSSAASGDHSVALGYFLTADGKGSVAMGGWATVRGIIGKLVRAVDRRSAAGDSQVGQFCYGLTRTTNATPVVLTTDGGGAGTTNQMILAANTTASFHGTIVAHGPAGDWKTWEIKGGIHRGATAGSTAVGTTGVTITVMDATAGAAAWTVAAAANTTNGGLTITVTGAAATDIDWGGNIHTAERTA